MENDFIIEKPFNNYLQKWVDYYFFIEIPVDKLKLNEEFVFPFPRITFGYFFEHPFLVTNHSTNENYSAEMIISRISTNQITVKPLTDTVKIVGAHIKPYALALLTNENISKMPWVIKTEDLFKKEAKRFKKKINSCSHPKEMFTEVEHVFLRSVLTKDLSIVIKAIDETPAAKPSSPSIRLIAFVIPTIQRIVIGILITPNSIWPPNGRLIKLTWTPPQKTTIPVARSCPPSFTFADNSIKSSRTPVTTMTKLPRMIAIA